ncbi:heavy metal translocating P-type ATPase [Paludicola sp. MB14-C6]|uniref:heavy metal translocating P-type ATPase n=1 Tax=Paludihabitans sp. MB14-C6 TaxID=3070656 RepID=UPI0027DC50E7|nr:heavy metal translocating P-type ATPase [Paludicola sp. MB14-C6]WMJ22436.1 heavy metal translocating P-type ATPase [Paludicola sp. MB14-C6]
MSKCNGNCSHEHHHHEHNHEVKAGKCSCGHDHSHEQMEAQESCTKSSCSSTHTNSHNHEEESSDDSGGDHHHSHNHSSFDTGCGCSGCSCSEEHSHDKPAGKTDYILLASAIVLFIGALFIPVTYIKIVLFAASALLAGYDLFITGLKQLFRFELEENVLLLIAVVASFALGEFPEACIVTILFKLGSFLESSAINRSKKNMEKLTQIRPDYAYIMDENDSLISVEAKTIQVGDIVYLRAGDRIAVDCEILEGNSSIDSSALTGESIPVYVKSGDELMSGSVNISGLLKCKATKSFETSTASQIINLVYQSSLKKGKAENFISKIAKVYTPIVVALALVIAVVPPLFGLGEWHDFIMRSLIFLVASCPCALVISIPLSFFAGIGAISKHGVLVKGSMYIEKLAKINAVALDKTGTITSGSLQVDEILTFSDMRKEDIISIVASIESYSTHPIAQSIVSYAEQVNKVELLDVSEQAGLGLTAQMNGKQLLCGGKNMLLDYNINTDNLVPANVYLCIDNQVVGGITMKEEIPQDSFTLRQELHDIGVDRVVMLTGDNEKSAKAVADQCNITEYHAGLLPKDKVTEVEKIKQDGNLVAFVGDGINDAPVLTCADLGISMGLGSEIANVSSDVILSSNKLKSLPKAIKLSKQSMRIVYFNIIFALGIKLIVLALGAFGYGTMWMAVFADIGVTILTVLNAIRMLRVK